MEVLHEPDMTRFVLKTESGEATVTYEQNSDVLAIKSTFVPAEQRGQGYADELVEEAFKYAESNGLLVDPVCPYVSETWLERHPDWHAFEI